MSSGSGELRSRLLAAKLSALVRDHWGPGAGAVATPFGGGAGASDGPGGDAWVLVEKDAARSLGGALAWAVRARAARLHLLVEPLAGGRPEVAGVLARRLAEFSLEGEVWGVQGRDLAPVVAAPVEPIEGAVALVPEVAAFGARIRAAGATPVAEHGVLVGEWLGLEVCRVVPDDDGGWRLAIGVGRHDRAVHDTLSTGAGDPALARVLVEVARHRRADAGPHPANSLAPERWLRAVAVADPALVGASRLAPCPSPVVRADLRQTAPACAVGVRPDGSAVIVVCSAAGIDLDLVPAAADVRLAVDPAADLVVAVDPAADAPVTRVLAALLRRPAAVTVVPADWRRLPG